MDIEKHILDIEESLSDSFSKNVQYFAGRDIHEAPRVQRWQQLNHLLATQRTTLVFNVGDKVHVLSDDPRSTYNIRAIVTEVSNDGWGYRLRAFLKDLPGIYMFNMWDQELVPRTGKERLPFKRQRWWSSDGRGW